MYDAGLQIRESLDTLQQGVIRKKGLFKVTRNHVRKGRWLPSLDVGLHLGYIYINVWFTSSLFSFSILPFLPPTTVVSYSAQYRASINNQVEIANSISITNLWLYRIELTSSLQLLTHPDQLPNNSHNDFQPFKSHASTPSNDMTHRKIERSLMLSMSPYPWYRIGGLKEDKK